ncbi:MAG: indole-3-glycerol phosphate synthase TrpC [Deltaproteobacteria bacterium]|nr:indole-3-glycerol phosphate synthase TrpC [Deltaproteobacteria bacterium]
MNILEKIVADKKREVSASKELYPVKLLEKSIYFDTRPVSLKEYLRREDKCGVIAEIKRKSPSRGVMKRSVNVEALSIGYMQAGASALSVLTDNAYFGGSKADLTTARKFNFCPILRKDFVIDEYQIIEAKSIGADAVLLIARILEREKAVQLARTAKQLGMEVLLEVHSREEIDNKLFPEADLVGVNNRDLDTLQTRVELSFEIAPLLPSSICKVSESGISDAKTILDLKRAGYHGFLIGESFMKTAHPERACARLISEILKDTLRAGGN